MLYEILIIAFALFFAYLSWDRAGLAIAMIVFSLYSYIARFELFNIPFTLLEMMILILFAMWLIKNFKHIKGHFLRTNKAAVAILTDYGLGIILLLIISLTAVAVSPLTIPALGIWKAYFLEPIMFFLVFINVIKNKRDLNWLFFTLGLSALVISALAIYQKFTGWAIPNEFWADEETRRVTSFFGYPNAVSLYLGPIIILYIGRIVTYLKKDKAIPFIFSLLVIISSLLSIIFAVSQGAWVGVAAGIIFWGVLYNNRSRIITISGLIILFIILSFLPNLYTPVLQELSFKGVSGQIRLEMWSETWAMLKDHFVFGAGLDGYQTVFDPYHQARHIEVYLYPHNIILNFWSELGLAGLILFVYFFVKFFRQGIRLIKTERNWALTLMAVMVTIIVHGLVDVPYFKNDLSVMFWLWLGMMTVIGYIGRGGRVVEGAALEKP